MIEIIGYGLIAIGLSVVPDALEEWERQRYMKEEKRRKEKEANRPFLTKEQELKRMYENTKSYGYTDKDGTVIGSEDVLERKETDFMYIHKVRNREDHTVEYMKVLSEDGKYVNYCYPKPNNKAIRFDFLIDDKNKIIVGYDNLFQPVVWDLKSIFHIFLGGITGAGKTTLLFYVIMQIIKAGHTMEIADLKEGVDHWKFENCQGVTGYTDNVYEALRMIEKFNKTAKDRMAIIKAAGHRDYNKYIDDPNVKNKMNRHFLIIDESADLMTLSKDESEIECLIEAGRKARSAGCHLILSTQRPCKDSFPTRLKSNMSAVIGMATSTEANSKILIDQGGCEKLPRHEALTTINGHLQHIKAYYLDDAELDVFCKARKKEVSEHKQQQEPLVKNKFIKENK